MVAKSYCGIGLVGSPMICIEPPGHGGGHVFKDSRAVPDPDAEPRSWPTPEQFFRRISMFTAEGRARVAAEDRMRSQEAAQYFATKETP